MKKIVILSGLIITLLTYIFYSYSDSKVIKIGLVAGLSGKYSSLGTDVRNGVVLAFEDINFQANGMKFELIQKDDKQNKDEAKKIINEFIKDEVKVVIGNSTSSMTKISLESINKNKDVMLISATASSDDFSFKKDNFIRTQVANNSLKFDSFSKYIKEHSSGNIITIYDPNNLSYSKGYIGNFQKAYMKNGGNAFVDSLEITLPYEQIKEKIQSNNANTILIVANSIDSAKLIQYLKLNKLNKVILCAGWAQTMDFIEEGGKAVEGVLFNTGYDDNSKYDKYLNFVKQYENKYKKKPSVFAAQAYETAKILIETLEADNNVLNLKNNILEQKKFKGLQGNIIFDNYGDVNRKFFMMSVSNGQYKRIN